MYHACFTTQICQNQELLTEFLHNKAIRKALVRGARSHVLHHQQNSHSPASPIPTCSNTISVGLEEGRASDNVYVAQNTNSKVPERVDERNSNQIGSSKTLQDGFKAKRYSRKKNCNSEQRTNFNIKHGRNIMRIGKIGADPTLTSSTGGIMGVVDARRRYVTL